MKWNEGFSSRDHVYGLTSSALNVLTHIWGIENFCFAISTSESLMLGSWEGADLSTVIAHKLLGSARDHLCFQAMSAFDFSEYQKNYVYGINLGYGLMFSGIC